MGKGGSGKSIVAGSLARLHARSGRQTLALDSDPMPGLAISLGLGNLKDAMLQDAVEKDLNGRWHLKAGIGGARAVSRYAVEAPDGVRFIQSGKADERGLSSIFGSVTGFGQVVHRLAKDGVMQQWSMIGDLSAGTRQTAYNWAPYADTYLLIVEPTWKSILTARRVARLAVSRGADRVWLVANKVGQKSDTRLIEERMEMKSVASIVHDPSVVEADRLGVAVLDHAPSAPAIASVDDLLAQLLKK